MFLMQKESPEELQRIKQQWLQSELFLKMQARIEALTHGAISEKGSTVSYRSGFCKQICMLLVRELRATVRNRGVLLARFGMAVFLAALYGWLFSGSAAQGDNSHSSEPNCVNFQARDDLSDLSGLLAATKPMGLSRFLKKNDVMA